MGEGRDQGGVPSSSIAEPRGLCPDLRIQGVLQPPGSKSLAIRALLAAALSEGQTRITAVPAGEDVAACLGLLRSAGVEILCRSSTEVTVLGRSPASGALLEPGEKLECGESGTLARLITAIMAYCGSASAAHEIHVSGTLRRRFSEPLFEALASTGVELVRASEEGSWPVVLRAVQAPETLLLQAPTSSQELSGLLIALAAHLATERGRSVLVMGGLPSEPYVEMTAGVLGWFGAEVTHQGAEWRVAGPLVAPSGPLEIETDASAAAVALAAACLSGGEVRVPGFQERSLQGDLAIVEHLRAFGCQVERQGAELVARGAPSQPASLDLADCPDLAPVLAAVGVPTL